LRLLAGAFKAIQRAFAEFFSLAGKAERDHAEEGRLDEMKA
jgi:hypothetical protein